MTDDRDYSEAPLPTVCAHSSRHTIAAVAAGVAGIEYVEAKQLNVAHLRLTVVQCRPISRDVRDKVRKAVAEASTPELCVSYVWAVSELSEGACDPYIDGELAPEEHRYTVEKMLTPIKVGRKSLEEASDKLKTFNDKHISELVKALIGDTPPHLALSIPPRHGRCVIDDRLAAELAAEIEEARQPYEKPAVLENPHSVKGARWRERCREAGLDPATIEAEVSSWESACRAKGIEPRSPAGVEECGLMVHKTLADARARIEEQEAELRDLRGARSGLEQQIGSIERTLDQVGAQRDQYIRDLYESKRKTKQHQDALNKIANMLHVVHEDDKIVDAVRSVRCQEAKHHSRLWYLADLLGVDLENLNAKVEAIRAQVACPHDRMKPAEFTGACCDVVLRCECGFETIRSEDPSMPYLSLALRESQVAKLPDYKFQRGPQVVVDGEE